MPPRQLVRQQVADGLPAHEGGEEKCALVCEQLRLRLTVGQLPHDLLVRWSEPPDLHRPILAVWLPPYRVSQYELKTRKGGPDGQERPRVHDLEPVLDRRRQAGRARREDDEGG